MADPKDKDIIIDFIKSKEGSKSKFYFNDLSNLFPDRKMRDVKKIVNELVTEERLVYWSSGSTTMYGLPGAGKQAGAEGES
ncbi:MAG: dissimilatory sulfite reductase-asociated protein DsvD [Deltaproteobacteria bacterium]|nr:dissimilatory sulfite reductase-asociated protein DsvD [Deltaproteobacteria bacterium]